MPRQRIVVVGSANADLVIDIDHRPGAGETILGSDLVTTPGGKGANQAVAAGLLGGDVTFVGCVGADPHGAMLRASLTGAGVDDTALTAVDAPTGTAVILVTPDGENAIIVSPSANRHVCPQAVDAALGRGEVAVVVTQLEIPLATVEHVARRAETVGARLVLNAAPATRLPAAVLAVADPLVVNESEAQALLGTQPAEPARGAGAGAGAPPDRDAERAVLGLLGLGARSVVLTLGAGGSVHGVRGPGGSPGVLHHVPARRVTAIDTTGAGDAFVGALAVELADGVSLADAVDVATGVAAMAVGRRGAQSSFPTRAEVAGR